MIDYDKLKLAHELLCKITDKYYLSIFIRNGIKYTLCPDSEEEHDMDFDNIDLLISKLKELTQPDKPKPKYEVGQYAWIVEDDNAPHCQKILEVYFDEYCAEWICRIANSCYETINVTENSLFLSREALIESQIEYWNKLLYPTIQESTEKSQENIKELGRKMFEWPSNAISTTRGGSGEILSYACLQCHRQYKTLDELKSCDCKKECKHEQCAIPEMVFRCIKCGEFYR